MIPCFIFPEKPALCIKRTNYVAEQSGDVNHHTAMQDRTINSALLALRKQIIRGELDGLGHVEALLALRGVHPPRVMLAKRKDVAKRGHMRVWLLDALRVRPMRLAELVEVVRLHQPDVPYDRISRRTSNVLWKMRRNGFVANEKRVWRLAP